jgi:cob(I)alamin adenosyltransferase
VLGGLDHANATIGMAVAQMKNQKLKHELQNLQSHLLAVGATLASEKPHQMPIVPQLPMLTRHLEDQIDRWEKQLPELKNFILPGGSVAGAILHQARTLIRQVERNYHRLDNHQKIPELSVYFNRLSDYLFQAARYYNFIQKQPETIWKQMQN